MTFAEAPGAGMCHTGASGRASSRGIASSSDGRESVMAHIDSGNPSADEILVDRARQGKLDAYNQLVLRYQGLAYSVAHRMLGDSDSAADATQDSFIKAYKRLDQYHGHGTSFRSWLMRIVVNTCYDVLRSRRRHSERIVSFDLDCGDDDWSSILRDPGERPEEYVLRREDGERVLAAIEALPADQRAVLILSDIEGLPYNEIADITGVPVGTVKSRLSRARARARELILAGHPGAVDKGARHFRSAGHLAAPPGK